MKSLILGVSLLASGISSVALARPTLVTFDPAQWLSPVYEDIIANEYGRSTVTHIKALLQKGCSVSITINIGD